MTINKQKFYQVALNTIKKLRDHTAKGKINWFLEEGGGRPVYGTYDVDGEKGIGGGCLRYRIKIYARNDDSSQPLEVIKNDKVAIMFYSHDDSGHDYCFIGKMESDDPFIEDTELETQMVGLYNQISESTCTSEEKELYYALDDICIGLGE